MLVYVSIYMAKNRRGSKKQNNSSLMSSVSSLSKMGSMGNVGNAGNAGNANIAEKVRAAGMMSGSIFTIIALVIGLTINISALMWINKLEEINCACSEHWMRTYIKYYLYVLIPLSIVNAIITILYRNNTIAYNPTFYYYYSIFIFIFGFFGFLNIFIAVIFINKLKEINCVCSEDIKREVYWIYNIILLAIIAINLLFALIMLPFFIGIMSKK